MAKKYNFSVIRFNRITHLNEEIQVVDCDSFDEAKQIVMKAVRDQELEEEKAGIPKFAVGMGVAGVGKVPLTPPGIISPGAQRANEGAEQKKPETVASGNQTS